MRRGRDVDLCVQILATSNSRIVSSASPPVIETSFPLIESMLLILLRIPLIPIQPRCLRPCLLLHSLVDLTTVQTREVIR